MPARLVQCGDSLSYNPTMAGFVIALKLWHQDHQHQQVQSTAPQDRLTESPFHSGQRKDRRFVNIMSDGNRLLELLNMLELFNVS